MPTHTNPHMNLFETFLWTTRYHSLRNDCKSIPCPKFFWHPSSPHPSCYSSMLFGGLAPPPGRDFWIWFFYHSARPPPISNLQPQLKFLPALSPPPRPGPPSFCPAPAIVSGLSVQGPQSQTLDSLKTSSGAIFNTLTLLDYVGRPDLRTHPHTPPIGC